MGGGLLKQCFSKKGRRLSNCGHLTVLSSWASKYLGRYRTRRVEDAPRLPVTESCRRMSSFCSSQVDSQAVMSGDVSTPTAVVRTKRIARRPLALTVSTVCLCGMIGRGACHTKINNFGACFNDIWLEEDNGLEKYKSICVFLVQILWLLFIKCFTFLSKLVHFLLILRSLPTSLRIRITLMWVSTWILLVTLIWIWIRILLVTLMRIRFWILLVTFLRILLVFVIHRSNLTGTMQSISL